jgi:nitrate reductase NapE component
MYMNEPSCLSGCPMLSSMPTDRENHRTAVSTCPLGDRGATRLSCPACGALVNHRSHRRGLLERLIIYTGGRIRRCEACSARFVRFGSSAALMEDVRQMNQRAVALFLKLIVLTVGILGGLAFLVWVWTRVPGS